MSSYNKQKQEVVTIDGPSGVGKSTISRRIAAELGYTYLDTGAMYRAVAFQCSREEVDMKDKAAVNLLLNTLDIQLLPPRQDEDEVQVLLADEDISKAIRTPEMSMLASGVSALPAVRAKLTALQQEMGKAGKLVAEGRDTGTVVFPSAAWKFYLDAAPAERCRRRVEQLQKKGQQVDEQEILAQIIQRDRNDQERTIAPLTKAKDAVWIDSSQLTIEEVVTEILGHIT
ncbi:MAG: (d)CMP kinase [Candidatus Electrothrix sp. AR3]|nr:(d)CMP kinase [Candidatus Electrothrix sp. AR3]